MLLRRTVPTTKEKRYRNGCKKNKLCTQGDSKITLHLTDDTESPEEFIKIFWNHGKHLKSTASISMGLTKTNVSGFSVRKTKQTPTIYSSSQYVHFHRWLPTTTDWPVQDQLQMGDIKITLSAILKAALPCWHIIWSLCVSACAKFYCASNKTKVIENFVQTSLKTWCAMFASKRQFYRCNYVSNKDGVCSQHFTSCFNLGCYSILITFVLLEAQL